MKEIKEMFNISGTNKQLKIIKDYLIERGYNEMESCKGKNRDGYIHIRYGVDFWECDNNIENDGEKITFEEFEKDYLKNINS